MISVKVESVVLGERKSGRVKNRVFKFVVNLFRENYNKNKNSNGIEQIKRCYILRNFAQKVSVVYT